MEQVEEQQEIAAAAVAAIAEERFELANAAAAFRQSVKLFSAPVREAAARGIRESIGDAPKAALGALNQARHALTEALDIVRNNST